MSRTEVHVTVLGDGWDCEVTVHDDGESHHRVRVTGKDLARLAPGASDPVELVQASFEFLLEREPKESILREFDLSVIGTFFPEYEGEIGRNVSDQPAP